MEISSGELGIATEEDVKIIFLCISLVFIEVCLKEFELILLEDNDIFEKEEKEDEE